MIAKRPAPPDDDGNLPSPSANLPDPALPQSTQRSDSAEARDYIAANPLQRETSVRAWLFFIAGVCLLAALWKPISAAYSRIAFEPEIRGPRDADSFIALAYGAVSGAQKPAFEEVTREKFEMQIQALRERGFNPIGLSDVKAFYEEGQLLPRKAVLITMEQSKRVSYLETRSILRSYRWKATMFVRSDTIENKDPGALRWPILREMAQSGTWEIGAQSADGYRSIPSGPDGKKGNFFSSPMWLAAEQRLESPDEFEARIRADHDLMLKHFQDGMGQHPIAFAYPYGDYGQYDPRAVPTRLMNVTQVRERYGLGFALGKHPLNTRHTHPGILNRLLVDPNWSLEEFLAIMEKSWAVEPWDIARPLDPGQWVTDWGKSEHSPEGSLWLKAIDPSSRPPGVQPTTGALAWMVSSDLFKNLAMRIKFRVVAGQFGIRLRAQQGGSRGLRILLDQNGSCWVNEKFLGMEETSRVAGQDMRNSLSSPRQLEIILRDRMLFVTLDGHMLVSEPIELIGDPLPGLLGFEVWAPKLGEAATEVLDIEFPHPDHYLKLWAAESQLSPLEITQRLSRDFATLGVISPPWLDATRTVPLALPKWNDDTLWTFARMAGIPVMPRIILKSTEIASKIPASLVALDATALGLCGVVLDCRMVEWNEMQDMAHWMQSVYEEMKKGNMKLTILFPESIIRLPAFASIAALFPTAIMAVESPELADTLDQSVPQVLVIDEIKPNPAGDMHLDLYYQLATRKMALDELTPPAKWEALRREGYLAFQTGDYARAIEQWSQWMEEDKGSSEAMALIGRVYMQKGDLPMALEYYSRSLQANPGQISLAIRRSEILEKMGRNDESREQLNLYARVFPENPSIIIAQAQWLDRQNRRAEARTLMEALVRESPMNMDARMNLLGIQEDSFERYQTMRNVLGLGSEPDSQMPFGYSLLSQELLTYPESPVFFEFIRNQAQEGKNTKQRELYESFLPLEKPVVDDFTTGQLSDAWIASGGMRALDVSRYELRVAVDQAETYLRLKRSELMRDGLLEVTIDESQGFFWVYARRSSHGMVRFGFDQEGFIHLQSWSRGKLESQQSRPWIRPPGSLKMRMEVRGDGVRGFVNDMEIFNGPVGIPKTVAYGWWGIAPFAFDMGIARARILRLVCQPSPTEIVLLPPGNAEIQVGQLWSQVGHISALAPAWIFQQPDGSLPEQLPADSDILKMFSSFHQMRLLPVVDLSYDGDIDPVALLDFVHANSLNGVVLKRRSQPKEEWLKALNVELEKRPANIIMLRTEAALWNTPGAEEAGAGEWVVRPKVGDMRLPKPDELIPLYEWPVGGVLIPPLRDAWEVPLITPGGAEQAPVDDMTTPRLYLLGPKGELLMPVAA